MLETVTAELIAELFDRHAATLELFAARLTTEPADCVQEAFIELARQSTIPDNPAAWLFRVAKNKALNSNRSQQRRQAREETAAQQKSEDGASRVHLTAATEIDDLLDLLDPQDREIVILRVWGQLGWQEIASVTGGSKSSAQRTYVKALNQLRQLLEQPSCPTNP